jgi:hypothetical protein
MLGTHPDSIEYYSLLGIRNKTSVDGENQAETRTKINDTFRSPTKTMGRLSKAVIYSINASKNHEPLKENSCNRNQLSVLSGIRFIGRATLCSRSNSTEKYIA